MRLFWKMMGIAGVLALIFLISFGIWGEQLEFTFSHEACVEWFDSIRPVAWLVADGLLIADILLPVPATGVMTALGAVYGFWLGGLVGALGSLLAGLIGYGLARAGGKGAVRRIASEEELVRFHDFFDRWGGLAIILTRLLPVLPEVMTIMAGLARMEFKRFITALVLGTIPTALLFAWIGQFAVQQPRFGLWLALGLPALLYLVCWRIFWWKK